MKKRWTSLLALAALAVGLSVQSGLCAGNSQLNSGINSYNCRRYEAAVQDLQAALRANPNSARAHYYLALSYQALHRFDEAKREYTWNYEHKTDKRLAYQSWQGLVGLQRRGRATAYSASAASPAAATEAGDSAPPDSAPTAGRPVAVRSVPLDMHYIFKAGCPRHGG